MNTTQFLRVWPSLCLGLCLGLISGCSLFGDSRPLRKPADLPVFTPHARVMPIWQASLGKAEDAFLTPAVDGKAVFAASADGLARFDGGQTRWYTPVKQKITGGVGAGEGVVLVGSGGGQVRAFNAETGAPMWSAQVKAEIEAPPAVSEGVAIVRVGDDEIQGFEVKSGRRLWRFHYTAPPLSLRGAGGILTVPGSFLVGFANGKLVAVNTKTGGQLWEGVVAQPKGTTELERLVDIASRPAISDSRGCAVAFQGRVTCFDFQSGKTLWSKEMSSRTGLDMNSLQVIVSDDNDALHAYDLDTGSSLWRNEKLSNRKLGPPCIVDRYVLVGDSLGIVHVLLRRDGTFIANFATDGGAIVSPMQRLNEDTVLVQTQKGGIYALKLSDM